MKLVIVESPAKCGKIQGFLGAGYKVIASMGHIRHLKEDLDSVGLDRDFEPTFEFMRDKAKARQHIIEAAKGAETVYLAADDDREGELIAYSVCLLLKLNPSTTPRAVFHEITETAVKAAIANPRTIDLNKVHAAEARAMLDMMIGFTMSPLLWKFVGSSLSAGRCQTAALRLVCDREKEIQEFQSSSSWKITGSWQPKGSNLMFQAVLTDDLEDADSAQAYLENHISEPGGKILSAKTTQWSERPPMPLMTSTLQQQASTLYRSNPKRTMQIAQRLYEAGHITYMRTDKAVLSQEAKIAAQMLVKERYGDEYISQEETSAAPAKKTKKTKETKEDAKPQAQEAHEAIRPTHMDMIVLPAEEDWNAMDRRIYELIWLRTLQSVMVPQRGDQRTIQFVADGDDADDFQWRATWRHTTFEGWRKAATKDTTEEEDADPEEDASVKEWQQALSLKEGQLLTWNTLHANPHETQAPQHYSEANLIKQLEERGIGRPSTFAALVSTIMDRGYVESKTFPSRDVQTTCYHLTQHNQWPPNQEEKLQKVGGEKDRLAPTALGTTVLAYLLEHFEDLFQYPFTATMEQRLDKIAEGQEPWKQVLRDTWGQYKERYTILKAAKPSVEMQSAKKKEFPNGLKAVLGKKGPIILMEDPDGDKEKTIFYGWPEGISFQDLTAEQASAFVEAQREQNAALGEYEGHPISKKKGKFGWYASWNGQSISCTAEDTFEQLVEKIKVKQQTLQKRIGQFEIRQGPYGLYMFKYALTGPSRKFVSVPAALNLETITEKELIVIFQQQLQQKARSGTFASKPKQEGGDVPSGARGGRGGWRGRGRGRGRGGSAAN
jgi:DNA topoisomerase-1